ncbi:MAG: hypothetical protein LC104_01835 [Bacteroidales bacterium]|nr:hypothetical protein [Bacteroidales bacterium]
MNIHRIRLRGFWESTPLPDGRTRHTRHFGRPRLPTGQEIIRIVCAGVNPVTVHLNGSPIAEGVFSVDVTERLQPRNTLMLDTIAPTMDEQVSLEIHSPAETVTTGSADTNPDSTTDRPRFYDRLNDGF